MQRGIMLSDCLKYPRKMKMKARKGYARTVYSKRDRNGMQDNEWEEEGGMIKQENDSQKFLKILDPDVIREWRTN